MKYFLVFVLALMGGCGQGEDQSDLSFSHPRDLKNIPGIEHLPPKKFNLTPFVDHGTHFHAGNPEQVFGYRADRLWNTYSGKADLILVEDSPADYLYFEYSPDENDDAEFDFLECARFPNRIGSVICFFPKVFKCNTDSNSDFGLIIERRCSGMMVGNWPGKDYE